MSDPTMDLTTSQDNILVFGLGAVGSMYAFVLSQTSNTSVTVCARSNFNVVRARGLDIQSEKFGNHPNYKFDAAVERPVDAASTKFSFVVCTNKAISMSPTASQQIAPVVSENTTIVLIQNGVGIEEEFRERFPKNTILSGVTWMGTDQPTTGTIVHKGREIMQFGIHWQDGLPRDVQQQACDHFVAKLKAGGAKVQVVDSIDLWRWKKTIWNCTWNTLTALSLCSSTQFLHASESGEVVARRIISEMNSIARAKGHIIEEEFLESLITRQVVWQDMYSSMYQDAKHGRPMEVDVIVGTPLRFAKELNIETPTLETIHALIRAVDWRIRIGEPRL